MNLRILWLIPVVLIVGLMIKNWSWSVSESEVTGTYANMNYDKPICCVEAPHVADTLMLLADGTFRSPFYGTGLWTVDSDGDGIRLRSPGEYDYQLGIDNELGQNIRVILNFKTNHYYERIQ